jgi:hypothetical protein
VQALDHATGYRIATAALRGLARRARGEGAEHAELALAQTAADLMSTRSDDAWARAEGRLQAVADGREVVPPPGSLDGVALAYPTI